jgi:hypothetical protein
MREFTKVVGICIVALFSASWMLRSWGVDIAESGGRTAAKPPVPAAVIILVGAAAALWFGRKKLLMTVPVVLMFLFLASTAMTSAIPARPIVQRNDCIANLRAIQDAKTRWAAANARLPTEAPSEAELYGTNGVGGLLRHRRNCQRGGHYTIGAVSENPTCTFSNKGHQLR